MFHTWYGQSQTYTTTASKYITKRPRICINWNPTFQTQIYLVKVPLNVSIVKQDLLHITQFLKILWSEVWKEGFQLMLILGLLGMYFDAAVVFVTNSQLFLRLAVAILWKGSSKYSAYNFLHRIRNFQPMALVSWNVRCEEYPLFLRRIGDGQGSVDLWVLLWSSLMIKEEMKKLQDLNYLIKNFYVPPAPRSPISLLPLLCLGILIWKTILFLSIDNMLIN